jgi:long-chain fatty acid transport protein
MNRYAKSLFTIATFTTLAYSGAYKIPEQSLSAVALSAAHVAHTTGADSAYYNPANMAFLDRDTSYLEGGITAVYLPSIDFDGMQYLDGGLLPAGASSRKEWAVIPYDHFVYKAEGDWRWGVSITSPVGLSKRWNSSVQRAFAEEFTLTSVEINPSLSYRLSDNLALAAGLRFIYSEGEVRSDASKLGLPFKRVMKGNVVTAAYNLALSYRPMPDLELAATFRSKAELEEKGEANLYVGGAGRHFGASVTIPMPATLNIAVAKTFMDTLTMELVYERTYWSSYKRLDFQYDSPIQNILIPLFDDPKDKYWKDSDTWRVGISYNYSDRVTLMCGYSYDETPIPQKTLGYELPDSDAHIFSAGFKIRESDKLSWGVGVLYDYKKSRDVKMGENINAMGGEFDKGGALLLTGGYEYRF